MLWLRLVLSVRANFPKTLVVQLLKLAPGLALGAGEKSFYCLFLDVVHYCTRFDHPSSDSAG